MVLVVLALTGSKSVHAERVMPRSARAICSEVETGPGVEP